MDNPLLCIYLKKNYKKNMYNNTAKLIHVVMYFFCTPTCLRTSFVVLLSLNKKLNN